MAKHSKDFFLVIATQLSQILTNLLTIKLLISWFSVQEFGLYSLAISIFGLASALPFLPIGQGILRYVSIYQQSKQLNSFLKDTFYLHACLSIVYLSLALILKLFFPSPWSELIPLITLCVIIDAFKNIFIQFNLGILRRTSVFIIVFFELALKIGLIYALHIFQYLSVNNVFIVYSASLFVCFLLAWLMHQRNLSEIGTLPRWSVSQKLLAFAAPLLAVGIFEWLKNMSLRWILNTFLSTSSVGIYSLYSSLAIFPANALLNFIGTWVTPILYQSETTQENSSRQKIIRVLLKVACIECFGVLVLIPLAPYVVAIFSDHKYVAYSGYLVPMVASSFFQVLAMVSTFEIYVKRQTKQLLLPMCIPGVLSMLLGIALVPKLGLSGAVCAFIVSNVVQAIWILGGFIYNKN